MLVEELTTGKELVVVVQSLGAHVEHVVGPVEVGADELLILIDEGLHSLTQVERLLKNVVVNLTTTQVGPAGAHAHVQGLVVIGNGTEQVAAGNGNAVEACVNLVVGILGENALIGHEAVAVVLVADTQLTTLAQSVGRTGTADEVVATQRGVAGHRAGGVVVVTHLHGMGVVVIVQMAVLQEDVLLRELAATKTEVSIEVPVLVGHRGADAGIGDRGTTLHGGEVGVIEGSVGHHAGTHGELHFLLGILELQGGIGVEVLGSSCQGEDSQNRHQNIFLHIILCRFIVVVNVHLHLVWISNPDARGWQLHQER